MSGVGLNLEGDKEEGNKLYEKKDYRGAISVYAHCIKSGAEGELAAQCHLNTAECYLCLLDHANAKAAAEAALGCVAPGARLHEKALFRIAKSIEGSGHPSTALTAYEKLLELYPENIAAKIACKRLGGGGSQARFDAPSRQINNVYAKMFQSLEQISELEPRETEEVVQNLELEKSESSWLRAVKRIFCCGCRGRGAGAMMKED